MTKFVFQPVRLESHFAVFGEQRRDFGDTQLGGFLNRVVHAVAARQTQRKMQSKRRCLLGHAHTLDENHIDIALFAFADYRVELAVCRIKYSHGIALARAEHRAEIMRGVGGQR